MRKIFFFLITDSNSCCYVQKRQELLTLIWDYGLQQWHLTTAQGIERRYPIGMPNTHSFEVSSKTSFCNTQERISEEAVLYSSGQEQK